jgi:gamma-glutamyl-gamma-aminobutyrate hydrolase PuuD
MPGRAAAASPLIVITVADPARADDPDLATRKNELYAAGIARHGGKPALLHTGTPPAERDRLLAAMDGLLLGGGADIDPALYGETVSGAVEVDPTRDELERSAWLEAERRSLPVFGICRGFQAINVFAGGKLLQDVPDHAGTPYGQGPAHTHDLEIEPGSRLGRAVAGASPDGLAAEDADDAALQLQVNSFHHQAICLEALAPGLRPSAWAYSEAGRLVEGLESREGRWIAGLQCHPERTESTPEELDGIWSDFVVAALAAASVARTRRAAPAR